MCGDTVYAFIITDYSPWNSSIPELDIARMEREIAKWYIPFVDVRLIIIIDPVVGKYVVGTWVPPMAIQLLLSDSLGSSCMTCVRLFVEA